MTTPQKIIDLVERFEANKEAYMAAQYNETQLRREFVDPFFKVLGWDIDNEQGNAESYKEVIHEDSIRIGGVHKAPDYCMRIGNTRKFFVEAKKPSVNVKGNIDPAFQVRRYGWSAKLPLSILTDFEEFSIYDCRLRPLQKDKPEKARIKYYTYKDYPEKWDEIVSIFSRDAVLNGSFDSYAEKVKQKKGTEEVDEAFLKEIEEWREMLAKNIALRNKELSQRELNFAVQQTIDRIVFLRICEDRGTEQYGRLLGEVNGAGIYGRLKKHFRDADERYNSGLFHFKEGKDQGDTPDTLTLGLEIDDEVLKKMISRLYFPESPYEFAVFSAEILGQVYEQFLGKVIRLTEGHQAKIEEKPEVRKAGGVYYTPSYIVKYIVEHTVGKLLEGKTPTQVGKLRIVDPACGSGSFLLGAYQYLLDWHIQWYLKNDPKKHQKALFKGPSGEWRLSTAERKRILLNNMYGVDIDSQAVEVTKLSLLLKVLEGETDQSLQGQFSGMKERALPNLGSNIKCGNSLIGSDFYATQQVGMFDEESKNRINMFDWEKAFPQVFTGKDAGFDAVIGNPPYIRIQAMKEWAPVEVEYYKKRYKSASKGNYDIYVVFVERMLSLLNKSGALGYILPHKFFNAQYGESLREILSRGKHLQNVVHFGDQQIFKGATTYTCLMFLVKDGCKSCDFEKVDDLVGWRRRDDGAEKGKIEAKSITGKEWNFVVGKGSELFERLKAMPVKLGDVADIFVGLQTSADDVFILNFVENDSGTTVRLMSKILKKEVVLEKDLVFPVVSGTDVQRYEILPKRQFILFPYTVINEESMLIEWNRLVHDFPHAAEYLLQNKQRLESRENKKFDDDKWYRFGRSQNLGIQNRIKLCVPRLVEKLNATVDIEGEYFLDNVDVGGITIKPKFIDNKLLYLLGLINSSLLRSYFPHVSAPFRGGFRSANRQFLSQLPFKPIDFSNPKEKSQHDHIVELVEKMLLLHKQVSTVKTPHEKEMLQRQIEATDREIDEVVFELYEINSEQRKLLSNTSKIISA